jgi:hypothetical protein
MFWLGLIRIFVLPTILGEDAPQEHALNQMLPK